MPSSPVSRVLRLERHRRHKDMSCVSTPQRTGGCGASSSHLLRKTVGWGATARGPLHLLRFGVRAYDGGTPGAGCADAGGRSCGRWHVHVMARGGAFGTSKAGLANGQGREAPGRSYCFIKRRYGASSISEVRSTQVTSALLRARTGQLHRSKAGHPGFRHYPNLPLRW